MKQPIHMFVLAGAFAVTVAPAFAKIPTTNATCPGNIEVHADAGGPVYVNGKVAALKTFNQNYYEAKSGRVTISLTISPDGSAAVSYTGPGRANGVCTVK